MSRRFAERRRGIGAALALALAGVAPPAAGGETLGLALDAQRTTIQWTLRGFPDTVHGTFRLVGGALRFENGSGAADGCLRVDARSGESGSASRDRTMHDEVLESARHPAVTLRPTRVEGALPAAGPATLRLQGRLALHGAEHPVALTVRLTRQGDTVTADTALTIPYVAWGLTDPSVLVFRASKTVELELHAVGVLTSPAAITPPSCGP